MPKLPGCPVECQQKWRETKQQPSRARLIRPSTQLLLSFPPFPVGYSADEQGTSHKKTTWSKVRLLPTREWRYAKPFLTSLYWLLLSPKPPPTSILIPQPISLGSKFWQIKVIKLKINLWSAAFGLWSLWFVSSVMSAVDKRVAVTVMHVSL